MKYFYLFLALNVISCTKYDHHEVNMDVSCELCDWADNLEGLYSGLMTSELNTPTLNDIWYDSLYIQVSHIFMNLNSYDDSTAMYFQFTEYHDSLSDPNPITYRKVVSRDSTGIMASDHYANVNLQYDYLTLHKFSGGSWQFPGSLNYFGTLNR
ncbi:MAG: hypothetical protein ACI837_001843 [Crocinitomicaceae bacterium]|jgi:hypothetical protein